MTTNKELEAALTEALKLMAHYAALLNAYDGGKRVAFTTTAWLRRMKETPPPSPAEFAPHLPVPLRKAFARLTSALGTPAFLESRAASVEEALIDLAIERLTNERTTP